MQTGLDPHKGLVVLQQNQLKSNNPNNIMEFLDHGVNIKLLKDNSYEFFGVTSNAKDIHHVHSWDPSA